MKDFDFTKVLYHYEIKIFRGVMTYKAITILFEPNSEFGPDVSMDDYLNNERSGEFFVERWSESPNDVELVKEMKNDLLRIYNEYIKNLQTQVQNQINIKNDLFKNELRKQKIETLNKKRDN